MLKLLLLLFAYIWSCTLQAASDSDNSFKNITQSIFHSIDQKLYQTPMKTRAIIQDTQGYLWIGTVDGLYRFDGYEMKLYRHQTDNINSLSANHVEDIEVDDNGFLWIATRYYGLSRFDPKTEQFLHFTFDSPTSKKLSSNTLFEIALDKNGLWIATANGLDFLKFSTLKVTHVSIHEKDLGISSLALDKRNNLWIGTPKGLFVLNKATKNVRQIEDTSESKLFTKINVKEILAAEDGTIWLGTSFNGHWRYFPKTDRITPLPINKNAPKAGGSSILQVNSEQIWIGNSSKGIEVRDAKFGQLIEHFQHDSGMINSLLPDGTFALFKDRSGLIWVGNRQSGIQYFNPTNSAFSIIKPSAKNDLSITATSVDSILEMSNGKLLLASGLSYAVDIIDPLIGRVETLKFPVMFENRERTLAATTMLEGDPEQLWLGSFPAFLTHYDFTNKQTEHFRVPLKRQRQGAILDMVKDPDTGYLWIAMSEGMLRFDPINKVFHQVEHDFGGALRLIHRDPDGNIWTGNKNGLFVLPKASEQWLHFNKKTHADFVNDKVEGILVDSQKRVWIGSSNELYLLSSWDKNSATFTPVNSKLNRQNLGAQNLLEDPQGRIWISLDAVFNPEIWTHRDITPIEKLDLNSFKGSYHKTKEGFILNGGSKGLLLIDTGKLEQWAFSPPLVISQIKVDQKRQLNTNNSIIIPADAKNFSVDFAAIDFTEPDNLSYKYKLDGYDNNWINTNSRQRVATYTSLAPGNYTLKVIAKNRANVWSKSPLAIKVTVHPKYFQTWWFRILGLIVCVYLLFQFIKWRVSKLAEKEHLKNEMLLITERAEMMTELVDKKNQLLADVSHELRTPLTVLQLKVEALQHNLVRDVDASYDSLIVKIGDINKLINDIYQLSQSDIGALQLDVKSYDSKKIINQWANELSDIVEVKGFEWRQRIILPKPVNIIFDGDKIKQVLNNLIANSIAYTDTPGVIRFLARVSKTHLEIKIEDSSPGVSNDNLPKLFERLFRIESSRSRATGGSGLGLAICKSIIVAHHGEIISSRSKLGGLAIVIKLPLQAKN